MCCLLFVVTEVPIDNLEREIEMRIFHVSLLLDCLLRIMEGGAGIRVC